MSDSNEKVSFKVEVNPAIADLLEKLQVEYGVQTKGRVIEMLLQDLLTPEE